MSSPFTGEPESWRPRYRQFEEDGGAGKLGQHNAGTDPRAKITHVDIMGLGLLGTVLSVAYGSYGSYKAMLLVMQFGFRAKEEGPLRFKRAEISLSFETQTNSPPPHKQPAVRKIFPIGNRTHPTSRPLSGPGRAPAPSEEDLTWPDGEYSVRGLNWTAQNSEVPNKVIWKVRENKGSKFGICDSIHVAAVVTCSVPFKATVDVEATTALGVPLHTLPWSKDDPLLFDGVTTRGMQLPLPDLSALEIPVLVKYISEAGAMSLPAISGSAVLACHSLSKSEIPAEADSKPVRVYRVRGIPGSYSRYSFVEVLSTAPGHNENLVHVHTFAPNPYRPEQMAVVSFDAQPHELSGKTPRNEWTLSIDQPQRREGESLSAALTLVFDTGFLGFSSLGRAFNSSSESHVDIIAVHGLGGHAYGSFKERGGTYMWLEDSLARDLFTDGSSAGTRARVLVYGYDAHVEKSPCFQSIRDLARALRLSLRAIRRDGVSRRPMIFICHSLGGLLVKELLIILGGPDSDDEDRANLNATLGALFFGVPNRGMDNTALLSIIKEQPNVEFLDSLSIGSTFLENQASVFPKIFDRRDSVIYSFYETCVSGTAMMKNGKLTMEGTAVVLVNEKSATHGRPWETGDKFVFPISRAHSEMVKWERLADDYERALVCIRDLLKIRAPKPLAA